MNEQQTSDIAEKIDAYFRALAEQAGVAAEHFWPIFVRQQILEGWIGIVLTALLITATVTSVAVWIMWLKQLWKKESDKAIFASVALGFLSVVLFFGSGVNIDRTIKQNITKIANPEYAAVNAIAKMIKE